MSEDDWSEQPTWKNAEKLRQRRRFGLLSLVFLNNPGVGGGAGGGPESVYWSNQTHAAPSQTLRVCRRFIRHL